MLFTGCSPSLSDQTVNAPTSSKTNGTTSALSALRSSISGPQNMERGKSLASQTTRRIIPLVPPPLPVGSSSPLPKLALTPDLASLPKPPPLEGVHMHETKVTTAAPRTALPLPPKPLRLMSNNGLSSPPSVLRFQYTSASSLGSSHSSPCTSCSGVPPHGPPAPPPPPSSPPSHTHSSLRPSTCAGLYTGHCDSLPSKALNASNDPFGPPWVHLPSQSKERKAGEVDGVAAVASEITGTEKHWRYFATCSGEVSVVSSTPLSPPSFRRLSYSPGASRAGCPAQLLPLPIVPSSPPQSTRICSSISSLSATSTVGYHGLKAAPEPAAVGSAAASRVAMSAHRGNVLGWLLQLLCRLLILSYYAVTLVVEFNAPRRPSPYAYGHVRHTAHVRHAHPGALPPRLAGVLAAVWPQTGDIFYLATGITSLMGLGLQAALGFLCFVAMLVGVGAAPAAFILAMRLLLNLLLHHWQSIVFFWRQELVQLLRLKEMAVVGATLMAAARLLPTATASTKDCATATVAAATAPTGQQEPRLAPLCPGLGRTTGRDARPASSTGSLPSCSRSPSQPGESTQEVAAAAATGGRAWQLCPGQRLHLHYPQQPRPPPPPSAAPSSRTSLEQQPQAPRPLPQQPTWRWRSKPPPAPPQQQQQWRRKGHARGGELWGLAGAVGGAPGVQRLLQSTGLVLMAPLFAYYGCVQVEHARDVGGSGSLREALYDLLYDTYLWMPRGDGSINTFWLPLQFAVAMPYYMGLGQQWSPVLLAATVGMEGALCWRFWRSTKLAMWSYTFYVLQHFSANAAIASGLLLALPASRKRSAMLVQGLQRARNG